MKFALLSHVLPPAPSGQSVMLFRILSAFAPDDYYLISREKYERQHDAKNFLPAQYHALQHALYSWKYLFLFNKFGFRLFRDIPTILNSIFARTRELVEILRRDPVDVLVACSGDLADIPAGFLASTRLGIPFIAYLFDDYVYQWTGRYRLLARIMAFFIFRRCAGAVGPNEFICDVYRQRYDVETVLVRNPGDRAELAKAPHACWPTDDGKITIVYTGAIYHANYDCFQNLVRVLDMVEDPRLELHIYTSQTQAQLSEQGIRGERVYVHSHVPYSEVLEHQRRADILFLPLAFETPIAEVIRTSAPGKFAEYLASGRPVLAHVPANSFVAYYLARNHCGVVASDNDPASLKSHLLRLLTDANLRRSITENARQMARLDFDPQAASERLARFLTTNMHRNTK